MMAFLKFSYAPWIATASSEVSLSLPVCFGLAPGYHVKTCPFMFIVRLPKSWLSEWMELVDIELHCRINRSRSSHFTVEFLNVTFVGTFSRATSVSLANIPDLCQEGYPFGNQHCES